MVALIFCWILLSFVAGAIGAEKKIGFGGALLISILLSPVVGMVVALVSDRKDKAPYVPPATRLDMLERIARLKEQGAITQVEFDEQKKKLMAP